MSTTATEELTATTVGHWIDGKPQAGHVRPHRRRLQSGHAAKSSPASASPALKTWTTPSPPRRPLSLSGGPRRSRAARRSCSSFRELIAENRRRLAEIISRGTRQDRRRRLGEVARGLENVEFACGIPNLLKGGFTEQASRGIDVYQIRQPLGVVAGITPFNFPAMVPMWMFATAIACGNTFVLKPSEKDPSASVFLAKLAARRPACRMAFSTSCRETRSPSTACWSIPT